MAEESVGSAQGGGGRQRGSAGGGEGGIEGARRAAVVGGGGRGDEGSLPPSTVLVRVRFWFRIVYLGPTDNSDNNSVG